MDKDSGAESTRGSLCASKTAAGGARSVEMEGVRTVNHAGQEDCQKTRKSKACARLDRACTCCVVSYAAA
eukprot:1148228-Pelagomonas_calceolata.AAC.7